MTGEQLWSEVEEMGIADHERMQNIKEWLMPFMMISVPESLKMQVRYEMDRVAEESEMQRSAHNTKATVQNPKTRITKEDVIELDRRMEKLEEMVDQCADLCEKLANV